MLYWDGNGSSAGAGPAGGLWDTSLSRWSTSSVGTASPGTWTSGETAVFSAGNDLTGSQFWGINGTTTQTAGGIIFQDGAATLSGGTVSLGSSGISLLATAGATTINSALSLTASQTWNNLSTNTLTVANVVNLGGNTLTVRGTGSTAISNVISNGSLTKGDSGTLTLSAANTYAGSTTLRGGGLTLSFGATGSATASNVINGASALTLYSGTLTLTGASATTNTQTFSGVTVDTGSSTITPTVAGGGTMALTLGTVGRNNTGTINFTTGTGITYNVSNTDTASGGILGPWAFVNNTDYAIVSGGQITALNAGATAETTWPTDGTGNVRLDSGVTVTLTASRSVNTLRKTNAGGANLRLNSNFNFTTNGLLVTGPLTIDRTSGTGSLAIGSSGQLIVAGNSALTISVPIIGTGDLVKAGTNTLTLSTADSTFSGQIYINQGTLTWDNVSRFGSANITGFVLNGGTIQSGNADTVSKQITVNDVAGGTIRVDSAAARNLTISGQITGSGGVTFYGNGGADKYITLTNNLNDFGGAGKLVTLANQGGLIITNAAHLGSGSNTIVSTGMALVANASLSLSQPIASSITLDATPGNTLTLTGAIATSGTLTINGTLSNPPGGVTTPNATSTVVLDGDLTGFTGGLTVNNGTLRIGSSATLLGAPGHGLVTLANTAGVKLDLNGRDLTIKGLATGGSTGGVITNSSGTAITLTLNPFANQSFAGVIDSANTINVLKINADTTARTQTFTNDQTYTGTTTVRGTMGIGGVLALTGTGAGTTGKLSGTSSVTVQGGATFQNGDTTVANNTAARVNASSSVTLGGTNYGGGTYTLGLPGTAFTQQHTSLTVDPGVSIINSTGTGTAAGTIEFTAASGSQISRSTGGIVTINTAGNFGSVVGTGGVRFSNTYTLNNGLLGPAVFVNLVAGGTAGALATVTNTGGFDYVSPLAMTDSAETAWSSTSGNYQQLASDVSLTASRDINTLTFMGASTNNTLRLNGFNLTVKTFFFNATGGGQANREISSSGGVLRPVNSGSAELVVVSEGNGSGNTLTISAPISNTSTLTKAGSKAVVLGNASNQIGDIYINAGMLQANASGTLGGAGTIYLLGGTLLHNYAGTLSSNKPIVVGSVGGTIRAQNAVDGSGQPTAIIAGDIALYGNLTVVGNKTTDDIALTGTISGPGTITASGLKNTTILLSGNNTFSGGVNFQHSSAESGTSQLMIGHDNALGTGALNMGGASSKGGILYAVGGDRTIANAVTTALMANNDAALGFAFAGTNSLTFTGPVNLSGNDAIVKVGITTAGKMVHISGPINATPANGLGKASAGVLKLSGANAYSGATTILNGTLLVGADAPVGRPGALGADATSSVVVGGSLTEGITITTAATDNLALLTDAAVTIARNITVNSNNTTGLTTLGGNSAHASTYTGGITLNRTVNLIAFAGGTAEFTGAWTHNNNVINVGDATNFAGHTGIVKLSSNLQTTGNVNVNAGKLFVNTGVTLGAAGGTTTIAANATLMGYGTISQPVAVNGGVVAPGGSIGTITVTNDVTWNAGSDWIFELGTAAASLALADSTPSDNDRLGITGAGSDFLKGTGTVFTFNFAGGGQAGWYKLVDWDGTTNFSATDFVATNLAAGNTPTFVIDPGTSALYLQLAAIHEPGSLGLLALGSLALLARRRKA